MHIYTNIKDILKQKSVLNNALNINLQKIVQKNYLAVFATLI